MSLGDTFNPIGHKSFGSPFYTWGIGGGRAKHVEKQLLPFQAENISTNQQQIPVPYLAGERVVALRWITSALDMRTKQADATGKKG